MIIPRHILQSMDRTQSMVTCCPLEFADEGWQSVVVFNLAGKECKDDRQRLRKSTSAFPIALELDLIEHAHASVVVIRLEISTGSELPLAGEVLLTPGNGQTDFETIKLLTKQQMLKWYFFDADKVLLHSQQHELNPQYHAGFDEVLQDAVAHDATLRVMGQYNQPKALAEITANYQAR